jgi:peroxiredoxin
MTLQKKIEEMQTQMLSQVPAETVNTLMSTNKKLFLSHIEKRALKAGDKMPEFQLNNHLGQLISSSELLESAPLIINFYRGSWCPYCNLELHALHEKEEEIKNLGAQLVAISPELPDGTLSSVEKHNLSFQVLSDIYNIVAEKFGLVFTLPDELKDIYLGFGINLEKANGNNKWQLPIPATYIVASDGIISYAFVNPDYTKRLEPEEIIEILKR